ncbi:hypothetical protein A6R68_07754 [Neotoma lepida]|uniref:GAB2 n=1 Tax=Neotoma lepida TaxID=56216 RepID=A0A1A6GCX4_NEOLE|nr:hypothetical protein A6R68_07754 [Neotoma lepida]
MDELTFKSPATKSWSRVNQTFNSSSSQCCCPISTQNITNTDMGDREENYVPMQNPVSAPPVPSGTNSPAPKKSTGNMDYLALDFQPGSPSPHCKPSISSVTSDKKEWTDVRQSSEPPKGAKL